MLFVISIELIVDGDAVPVGSGGGVVPIQSIAHAIEGDRFVEKLIVRSPLHLNDEMIPAIAYWVAGDSG